MDKNEFYNACKSRNLDLSERQLEQFDIYAAYLKEYNEKINLTAIYEYEEVLEKHFFDSLLLSFKYKLSGCFADVGSGAGFPGVVLKIAYPELRVVLIEPLKKRCLFLNKLIEKLDLKDIEVINARSEDLKEYREYFDYVSARAVTNLNNLIEICGALVKKGGYFIALRGANGEKELESASKAIKEMGFEIKDILNESLSDEAKRIIAYLYKNKPTPLKYPRNYSIIKKKPL